jgi:hypothetical protein
MKYFENVERRKVMRSGFLGFTAALMLVVGMVEIAGAQTTYTFRDPASETGGFTLPAPAGPDGLWALDDNWFDAGLQNRFVPNAALNESANIAKGGIATLDVDSPSTGNDSKVTPGGLTISNGGLNITDTGALFVTAGTATDGNVILGGGATTGFVNVAPGGTLTTDGPFISQANAGNILTAGGTAAGTTTVTLDSATFNGVAHVYPNADFGVTNDLTFGPSSAYNVEIDGASSNSFINVGGDATFNGTVNINFSGASPSFGNSWTIIEANSFDGTISGLTHNAALAPSEALVVIPEDLGGGRTALNVRVVEVLKLQVNRNTGEAILKNEGTSSIDLDGYFLGSSVGSLSDNPANWTSITEGGLYGGDWVETAQTTTNIGELKIGANATIGTGTEINLGNIYNAFPGAFGNSGEDIEFGYRRGPDGIEFRGQVEYIGDAANTLVLQVDPNTGEAVIRNTSPTSVQIDGYDVTSANGSLDNDAWNSLDEQGADGDAWLELLDPAKSANQIGEFNSAGFTTIGPNQSLSLGPLFNGGEQDLEFSFLMMGQDDGTDGIVIYNTISIPGDYDNSGQVAQGDLDLVLLNWGKTVPPDSVPEGWVNEQPSGLIGQSALDGVLLNWGNTAGSGAAAGVAVPEPTAALLALVAMLAVCGCRARTDPEH